MDLSNLIMVRLMEQGKMICRVVRLSGILGYRKMGSVFGNFFILFIVCIFSFSIMVMMDRVIIQISGDGMDLLIIGNSGNRQMIFRLVVVMVYICQVMLVSFGSCVMNIRIVKVLMKLVIIEWEMKCIRFFSFRKLAQIWNILVSRVVVSRYFRLCFFISVIINSVIVLVVVLIMFGCLFINVIMIVI